VGALQTLAPEHVVYAGTASKSLAPGLRLAWLVLPAALVGEVAEAERITDGTRVRSSSSRRPSSSPAVITTGTYGAAAWPTGAAVTGRSPRRRSRRMEGCRAQPYERLAAYGRRLGEDEQDRPSELRPDRGLTRPYPPITPFDLRP
jgi:aspartate/methionine/tyrosine aminotransferase